MSAAGTEELRFLDCDAGLKERVRDQLGESAAAYLHLAPGFSIVAVSGADVVGIISVRIDELPEPLKQTYEGYIDIIEVVEAWRRRGVGRELVRRVVERCTRSGLHQVRAWSTEDKTEAIPMWRALGFGLAPTTIYPGGQEVKGYYVTMAIRAS